MTPVTDSLLQLLAKGTGRAYPHESKAMALELIELRAKAKAAAANLNFVPRAGTTVVPPQGGAVP